MESRFIIPPHNLSSKLGKILKSIDVAENPAKIPTGKILNFLNNMVNDIYSLGINQLKEILRSLLNFIWAGLLEIGGGYLIWQWLKAGKPIWWGLAGGIALVLYGVVATLQTEDFGRVYAAYGGVFITMATLWGWQVDGISPDRYDILGASLALIGVLIIMYAPRG